MAKELDEEIETQRTKTKDQMKQYKDDNMGASFNEISTLPTISDPDFDLQAALESGASITVEVVRLVDEQIATCDLVEVEKPLDHCPHTPFDDMYYDYLCLMVDDF